ncbi:MAG: PilZ domain-containing protein [Deltaproteobacteria bacterium]|nr:PilZ domain-containing protein [Deltaproteobacteria bacterium]
MLRVPCPNCHEISYTPDVEAFFPCPFCGFIFSGKFGQERRREARFPKEIPFTLSYQGQDFSAHTIDISPKGVGIEIFGAVPVEKQDTLNLAIESLGISSARVMWVRKTSNKSQIGLEKLN